MHRRIYPYDGQYQQPVYQNPTYSPNQFQHNYYQQGQTQTPFEYYAKPNQPVHWPNMIDYANDTPLQQPMATPSLLTQFQTEDGQVDVQKMLSTVGQLANTVQQVSPVIKEIGAMISIFRQ